MNDGLKLLFVVAVLLSPYLLLFYKKINFRLRLFFVSIVEIVVLGAFITVVFFGNGIFAEEVFFYNQFVWLSVFLNLLILFISWVYEGLKFGKKRPKS